MASELHIRKWGNSLAVRLPRLWLKELQLGESDSLRGHIEDGRLVLEPVKKYKKYSLSDLLEQFESPQDLQDLDSTELDWGQAEGDELW